MKLNNSKKQLITSFGSCILATFLAFVSVHYLSFFKNLENIAEDIRIAAFSPSQEQSKDIVIVAINEATLEQFQYRSPLDREFIAKLLQTLEKKGAKVIGLDILLDQPTEQSKDL
jgi:CHASE2 domain-containing sensor protein